MPEGDYLVTVVPFRYPVFYHYILAIFRGMSIRLSDPYLPVV